MYRELVKNLTKEQIDALEKRGVARSTVSNWKHGKRLPTRPQAIHLAQVTGVEVMDLERELMVLESAPEQREQFLKLLKVPASAIASAILVLGMFGTPEKANADNDLRAKETGGVIYIVASMFALEQMSNRDGAGWSNVPLQTLAPENILPRVSSHPPQKGAPWTCKHFCHPCWVAS